MFCPSLWIIVRLLEQKLQKDFYNFKGTACKKLFKELISKTECNKWLQKIIAKGIANI